jgi:hypothetical protein
MVRASMANASEGGDIGDQNGNAGHPTIADHCLSCVTAIILVFVFLYHVVYQVIYTIVV